MTVTLTVIQQGHIDVNHVRGIGKAGGMSHWIANRTRQRAGLDTPVRTRVKRRACDGRKWLSPGVPTSIKPVKTPLFKISLRVDLMAKIPITITMATIMIGTK